MAIVLGSVVSGTRSAAVPGYNRAMASYEKRTWWTQHGLSKRLTDETFLEAAVTTAFLIAAADGNASEQEYDALLDRLELLGGVERDRIDEVLTAVSNDVEANGFERSIARVAELVGDRASAEAALMLGLAIGLADNEFSTEEREVATQLATALSVPAAELDAWVAVIRG